MTFKLHWREHLIPLIEQFAFMELELRGNTARIDYALSEIELRLSSEPADVGESRDGNERIFISNPITVQYEVFGGSSVVVIYTMKHHEYGLRPQ